MKYWIFIAMLCLTACKPKPVEPETYYLQIKDTHLRIPGKYAPIPPAISRKATGDCQENFKECVQRPPGVKTQGMLFIEQNFYTFERYSVPKNFQGLSDTLTIHVDEPGDKNIRSLPNFAAAWNPENRDAKTDIYGLSAYKSFDKRNDDINYRYDFGDGVVLFMTCKNFTMPNPGCAVSTTWSGLLLRYDFRHRHLAEWLNLHQRLIAHLNSFVYQP